MGPAACMTNILEELPSPKLMMKTCVGVCDWRVTRQVYRVAIARNQQWWGLARDSRAVCPRKPYLEPPSNAHRTAF